MEEQQQQRALGARPDLDIGNLELRGPGPLQQPPLRAQFAQQAPFLYLGAVVVVVGAAVIASALVGSIAAHLLVRLALWGWARG